MFEKIRKPRRAKNIISYIIFGLICLVFVFIGVPIGQVSSIGGAAFVVNSKVISWLEYRSHLEMLEQQSQGALGSALEAERQKQLRKQAVDNLLTTELISQEEQKSSIAVAAEEVRDKILDISVFQEEGRFTHSKYRAFLEARRFSPSYFENMIKREIQISRMQNVFDLTVRTSKEEEDKKRMLESFKVKVSYIQFSSNELDSTELNNVNTVVESGDLDTLDETVKSKKWRWMEINSFDLNRISLPDLESEKILFDKVLSHLPHTGIIKKIINVRDRSFILKVDGFNYENEKIQNTNSPAPDSFFTNMMASRMVFLSWMRFARSSAKLKFNPRLNNISGF